ncbi:MAG: acetylglutamate kinase [Spirochaetaceae bacterium]|nr:MAG: acetylglutamate kinase [Spirochaetaceae bacterium]
MDTQGTVVLKIGGRAVETELIRDLTHEIAKLAPSTRLVVIHGGGAEVTRVSELFGIEARFEAGIRMTGSIEMQVVDMVLAGKMNKALVRMLLSWGVRPVGFCGADAATIVGVPITDSTGQQTATGRIDKVETGLIKLLLDSGYLPVIASSATTREGMPLNINADDVAFALAGALRADNLVFLSDIPGILKQEQVLRAITPTDIEREIQAGVIAGGMIPKTRSAQAALAAGVSSVVIGRYSSTGDLQRLLGNEIGTRIST